MNIKTKISLMLVLLITGAASVMAQVTIGSVKIPETFSILELINGSYGGDDGGGMRLPQLTMGDRMIMQATQGFQEEKNDNAVGLQIFNKTTRCVETWNGDEWIQECVPPATGQVAISISDSKITYRDFMSYNLGAQDISIKEQLLHNITAFGLTENQNPTQSYTPTQKDAYAKVYGSKYQWGCQSDGHENVWSTFTTNAGVVDENINVSTDGQVIEGKAEFGLFIKASAVTQNDWYTTLGSAPYWNRPYRWDGKDYTSTPTFTPFVPNSKVTSDKGVDPCPAGFRVPSKEEWVTVAPSSGLNNWVWVAKGVTSVPGVDLDGGTVQTAGYLIYPAATAFGGSATFYSETPALFLPAAGYRSSSNGNLDMGGSGLYWSSTAGTDVYGHGVYFTYNTISSSHNYVRADGMSVRCVAD
jgi:uncharacterized protein (TIGR02145 family)